MNHLRYSQQTDKNPQKSPSTTYSSSKPSQNSFCIASELCFCKCDSLVKCNADLCVWKCIASIVQKLCGIWILCARGFALEFVVMLIQIPDHAQCLLSFARSIKHCSYLSNLAHHRIILACKRTPKRVYVRDRITKIAHNASQCRTKIAFSMLKSTLASKKHTTAVGGCG